MTNKLINVGVALGLLFMASCGYVPPGYVGIKVNLFGSDRGVQDTTIVTGRVYYNPYTTAIYEFPTFMNYKIWTSNKNEGSPNDDSITFVSKDRVQVNVDVSVAYQFEAAKVPELFVTFRQDPETIANTYIRSRVRDAFVKTGGEMDALDIVGGGIPKLTADVTKLVNDEMGPMGIHFDYVSIVGHPRIPAQIQDAINQAIESTQRAQQAQNQVAVVKAEADQRVAKADGEASAILVVANANAKANQVLAQSVTPELLQLKAIEKWDGHVSQYSSSSAAIPFLSVGK